MLIKAVDRRGNAVSYTPEESIPHAVERGVKGMNTLDKVYWLMKDSIKVTKKFFGDLPEGDWEAIAEGTADIGYTDAKTDIFHDTKVYKFKVQYKPGKDSIGLPDIKVVKFEWDRK
jgi:hypothetical protein